jgi:hypothetical protein
LRRGIGAIHRSGLATRAVLPLLCLMAAAMGAACALSPRWMPLSALGVVLVVGGYFLRVRSLLVLFVVVAAVTTAVELRVGTPLRWGVHGTLTVTGLVVLIFARSRARLGVLGTRGESMLVDLRDRLRAQGEMPDLPAGWAAEVVLRSANGASFSGDFLVASRSPDGATLEVAIVDVSGKGLDAGTRALLLSGAFGGLLGAMPAKEFLTAADAYLSRQQWEEGFATAAHVAIDLASGEFVVTTAGHPPAAQFHAGSGLWLLKDLAEGPLLGVTEDATFTGESGRLDRGDALLLYTDGLVEVAGRDLSEGIDKLLGEAERLVTKGFRNGARRLIDAVAAGEGDDRALVLIWRT